LNPDHLKRKESPPAGVVIAALRGGSGKTIFSVGIIAALRRQGLRVAPFKKGPDYIDAGWLALAAGRPCYNLDTFLVDSRSIIQSFQTHADQTDLAVIEGNRGLYDCIDTGGETSTAELAKLLRLPLILCIDGTKTTRTMAAVVSGCKAFDPNLKLKGVVLNRVAGARHERILRDSIEYYCDIPVLGAIPKQRAQRFPERHMGLVPTCEHDWAQEAVTFISDLAQKHLDLAAIRAVAEGTHQWARQDVPVQVCADLRPDAQPAIAGPSETRKPATVEDPIGPVSASAMDPERPRIGILRDSAFQFYYPENLEALTAAGADLIYTSPLTEKEPPPIDGLYIGGGFPETHARQLSENQTYAERIRKLSASGLPVYAECGGLMYLGRSLVLPEGRFDMAGVLPVVFGFSKKPQGHGYTILRVDRDNPYFKIGTLLKGHEFHYSTVEQFEAEAEQMAFVMQRGNGIFAGRDGLCMKNVLATYTHIHALGTPEWAPALVARARQYRATGSSDPRRAALSR
jgi:cobyrinic acid a,c-diamide synthase